MLLLFMVVYPVIYIDDSGKEDASFISDGTSLTIRLRRFTFTGGSFESLSLKPPEEINSGGFSLDEYNCLTNCVFQVNIPIKLTCNSDILTAILNIEIVLENTQHPKTRFFSLTVGNEIFDLQKGGESEMWFETQMIQLQRLLPQYMKIHTCIFCSYSNYWVAGNDSFGTLTCYKDIKNEIVTIKDKSSYMAVAENNGTATQETFWCSEFTEIGKDQWQYKDQI
ncbi:DUF6304 family protein [Ferruginibacter sp.]